LPDRKLTAKYVFADLSFADTLYRQLTDGKLFALMISVFAICGLLTANYLIPVV
jgi:hypothetical protein